MRKRLLCFSLMFFSVLDAFSKEIKMDSYQPFVDVPTHFIAGPDIEQIHIEDAKNDRKGMMYRIGVSSYTNLSSINSGVWKTLSDGKRMWQLNIKNPGAEALSFIFEGFNLSKGSIFFVQDLKGKVVSEIVTEADEIDDLQQHIPLCFGDDLVLTLVDQPNVPQSEFVLKRVMYNYRSTGNPNPPVGPSRLNESESCEINVNCSEGNDYQDEKKGVARVNVIDGSDGGLCSGSLINNLKNNCRPLFLTALHCGPTATAANMKLWVFYFGLESPTCQNPSSIPYTVLSQTIKGCVKRASSNDIYDEQITASDFLLVQLGTVVEYTDAVVSKLLMYKAYWNGWDANVAATTGGVSIHHPKGDIKKISTFSGTTINASYGNYVDGTHWEVYWSNTANGKGTTEPGSSGSPLFNKNSGNSRIVGTLTGGRSCCRVNGCGYEPGRPTTGPTFSDYYGKLSYHWERNSPVTDSTLQLKPHLDPANTGVLVQNGSNNPCNFVSLKENTLEEDVSIYPNPAVDNIHVDLRTFNDKKAQIQVLDLTGKVIYTAQNLSGELVKIDITNCAKGIYQVIVTAGGEQLTKRISKL